MLFDPALNIKNEELQQYVPVASAFKFAKLTPYIILVEQDYIVPLIGEDMYIALQGYYDAGSTDPKDVALITITQRAIANLAFYIGFANLNTEMTASGFHRTETEDIKQNYKYVDDALKRTFEKTGFDGLDIMLSFLEINILIYPEYKLSETYIVNREAIFPSTSAFNYQYAIKNSRLTFLRLQQTIKEAEELIIAPAMGIEYQNMKDALALETQDPVYLALREIVQKPTAYYAVASLLMKTPGSLTDKGQYFENFEKQDVNNRNFKPVSNTENEKIADDARRKGDDYFQLLIKYLEDNFDLETSSKIINRDNEGKKTFWT